MGISATYTPRLAVENFKDGSIDDREVLIITPGGGFDSDVQTKSTRQGKTSSAQFGEFYAVVHVRVLVAVLPVNTRKSQFRRHFTRFAWLHKH